jgi:soluble lytic murein transglycosylase-like protein
VHSETLTEAYVRQWAINYHLSPDYMWSIALCESGGDPYISNAEGSGAVGLFQFMPATYAAFREALNNDPTLAPGLSAFDPEYRDMFANDGEAEAHLAAWMFYRGYSYLWACR